jgi:hypothetical protein
MTFLDKAKMAAEKAAAKAQQGVHQGQAKLDAMQAKRKADALLRELGAAYYAEQRQGGLHEPVERALAALDAHEAEHGEVDTAAEPEQPSTAE